MKKQIIRLLNRIRRKYNANTVADNLAGVVIPVKDFIPTRIREVSEQIIQSKELFDNAAVLGAELASAGGISIITHEVM